ncbi:hypothetical protein BKI52_26060 [marine bacterium AO1-C]|nr:hypothetical protein BKI52_26060 [marine bacterium AO1-C]
MKIYSDEWSTRSIKKNPSLMYVVAYPSTIRLNDEDFLAGAPGFLNDLRKHDPRYILLNLRGFQYTIVPEVQDWLVENFFPFAKSLQVEKIAIVTSLDALSHLSVEQAVDEDEATKNITKYFEGEKAARHWLLENQPVRV